MNELIAPRFWPTERRFWQMHAGGMLLIVVTQMLSAWMWGNSIVKDAVATLVWMVPYTLSVLLFRRTFLRRNWSEKGWGKLSLMTLVYGTLAGMMIASTVYLVTMSQKLPGLVALKMIVGNGLSNQLFVCAWIFIFMSAIANGRAREAELANLRLQNHLKEARLATLSNQLNPHFLFNALNNLRFLIHEDGRLAEQMVTQLSDLLRYALQSSRRDTVPLAEEMEMVDRYLAVMAIQMEARLSVERSIDPEMLQVAIPPMSIQLLVENAIKHGLEGRPRGGTLTLAVRAEGSICVVEVCNDKAPPSGLASTGEGIGLDNIRRRLGLLFGPSAALIVSDKDDTFVVRMRIPGARPC